MRGLRDPRNTLWVLPLLAVALASLTRLAMGEAVTPVVLIGGSLVGLTCAGVCIWWHSGLVQHAEKRLDRRTEELVQSQELVRNLVDSSPDAIVATDLEGRITFFGTAAERLLRRERETVLGRDYTTLFYPGPDAAEDLRRRFEAQRGALLNERVLLCRGDRTPLPASLSLTQLLDDGGHPRGVLAVVRDISERVRVEEEHLQAERLRALGEGLAGIAHELNNPLTAITGLLEVCAEELHDESGHVASGERVAQALAESRRMSRTIRTMLAFARRHESERRVTDVGELLWETLGFLGIDLRRAGIDLEAEIDELPHIILDQQQIRQVLMNLVANAREALLDPVDGDSPQGKVTVRCEDTGEHLRLTIADNGPGISTDARGRLFEPFYTTKPGDSGSGLGLAICREFVEAHAGTIRFEDTPGGGATFVVELPRLVPAEPDASDPPPTEDLDFDTTGTITTPTSILRKRVLVVEDEPGIASVCSVALEGLCDAVIVSSPAEAQRLIEDEDDSFDALLADVRLSPTLTGFDLVDAALERRPHLRGHVAVMTGDTEDANTAAAVLARSIPILAKPFGLAQLRAFVASLISDAVAIG